MASDHYNHDDPSVPDETEHDPFLHQFEVDDAPQSSTGISSRSIARKLYVSHFLSTWNSRVFEFGAVLYLAAAFPGTLLPLSVYAVARSLSAIVFAPAVGQYIDTGNRLQVVRASIGT
jgi:solute carrier family 40 (iron-regulated transporter), member 1